MGKASQYRDMSWDELKATYRDCSKELFQLVNQLKLEKKLEKPHLLRLKRKEIARMLTIMREKELAQQVRGE